MWDERFQREPIDMRLLVLRFFKKMWIVVVASVFVAVLISTCYFLVNIVGPGRQYRAQSMYYVEFAIDPRLSEPYSYYNDYTWNTWITSDEFVGRIQEKMTTKLTDEELRTYLFADLLADLRMPVSMITTDNKELTMEIVKAVEETFVEMSDFQKEVDSVKVVDSPDEAKLVIGVKYVLNLFVLSFIFVFLVGSFVLGIMLIWDPSIYLPVTIEKRYQIPMLGTLNSIDFSVNFEYLLKNLEKVGLTAVLGETDLTKVKEEIVERVKSEGYLLEKEITCIPSPLQCPEGVNKLREEDGLILIVEAGKKNAKQLEYILEFLKKQNIKINAALLWDADETLIKHYYFGQKKEN